MRESDGFSGWEHMESMELISQEVTASQSHMQIVAALGRAICFDKDEYVVGNSRGPERAVTFIDEDRHVTVVAFDERKYCELGITIDQRDQIDENMVIRKFFEVKNDVWFRKNKGKIRIAPFVSYIIDNEVVDLNETFPKNKPSQLYSWRARRDYRTLKRREVTNSNFSLIDFNDVKKRLTAYGKGNKVFECGDAAAESVKNR